MNKQAIVIYTPAEAAAVSFMDEHPTATLAFFVSIAVVFVIQVAWNWWRPE